MAEERHTETVRIQRLPPDHAAVPLSFAQERMWFLEQLTPGTPLYNIPWAVRVSGPLDLDALRRSLQSLVERHASLRTTYEAVAGVPRQVVRPSLPLRFDVVDLPRGSHAEREDQLQQWLREEAARPFDLASDCMLRAAVLRLTESNHVLLLVAHHIAVDGWSRQVLDRELGMLYESFLDGSEADLPDLPIQYADYAAWQRDGARTSAVDEELAYWRTKLEGLPTPLELPMRSEQEAAPSFSGGEAPISISEGLARRIYQFAGTAAVTPFMVLAAAVMVTLHRYTAETDIAIGIPIAGRTRVETEDLVGLFVNTLVLRGDLSDRPSFAEVTQRVKGVCLEAYDHQEAPFERIVAELGVERIKDRAPIVRMTLAYGNLPSEPLQLAGAKAEPVAVSTATSKFDLSFSLGQSPTGMTGRLIYSRRCFGEDRMRVLAAHFVRLLEAGVDHPERPIAVMSMLSASERKRILVDWNAATAPEPEEPTIHGLFERTAASAPQSTAVVYGDARLTYSELNERADRVASYLQGLDVQPDELVGVLMQRSANLIVGLLGILKSGGAYLPLDPRWPSDRLRFMMEDAAVRVLVTESRLAASLSADGIHAVRLDSEWPAIARTKAVHSTGSQPENLAYVMYTSGSTGKPKGVMISHRNVVGFLNAFRLVVGGGPGRISTNVITYAFDTSVEEIFSPLCYGGTLHVVPDEITFDGRSLARYLLDHEINTAYSVPDLLPGVAEVFEEHGGCGQLACLITGLAPKKQQVLQRLRDISPTLRILNAYGPTEVTYGATAYEFESAADPECDVPIGRPFPDGQVYIVNDMLEPVPIGATGEILIGGVGVSRGYLNRPDLTAERFIPNPFSAKPESRLFRTGDLGRYLDDGTIEFLGRGDSQVKIRGHRIELREIELTLESHPQVTTCYVNTDVLAEDDVRLVAYVVGLGNRRTNASTLRHYLKQQLPDYMLPSAFVFLDALPLLPTGKVDKRALPRPQWKEMQAANRPIPPSTEIERAIVDIWEDVLKVGRMGVTDNFFELGGHSLLAVRVIARIEELIGARLSVAQFFEHPTIAGLASLVRPERRTPEEPFLLHVQTGGKRRPFFCMAEAEHMFAMAEALGPDQPFYGLRIPGLGERETPLDTVEAMAVYCIRAIEAVDPDGPFIMGGHCFGAMVALEAAHQLARKGKAVDLLVLLAPDNLNERTRKLIHFWSYRLWYNIKRRRVIEAIRNRWRSLLGSLDSLWDRDRYLKLKRYTEARARARAQYQMAPYFGRVLFVWPTETAAPPSAYRDYVPGRQRWLEAATGETRHLTIEGTHTSIFRQPGLLRLAEELRSEFGLAECAQGTEQG